MKYSATNLFSQPFIIRKKARHLQILLTQAKISYDWDSNPQPPKPQSIPLPSDLLSLICCMCWWKTPLTSHSQTDSSCMSVVKESEITMCLFSSVCTTCDSWFWGHGFDFHIDREDTLPMPLMLFLTVVRKCSPAYEGWKHQSHKWNL